MLYNFKRKKLCRHLLVGGALFAAGFGMYSCTDTYDLDSEQPSNLNSLYGYIFDKGGYTQFQQLIKDLGQDTILSRTGSKTLFVASDDAFAEFYKNNSWNVKNYNELTQTQKWLLLNAAMIDNPITTSMLSTASTESGPVKGEVCRRYSSLSLYDSVDVVSVHNPIIPQNNPHWASVINSGKENIVLFRDESSASPMVHFTAKFLSANKILNSDVDFLYNQPEGTRQADDVYVGNSKVTVANQFCLNGFIHEVDEVLVPLDNMAEIIRTNPNTSRYSSLLERFSAPAYSATLTDRYNNAKGTDVDSVFIKRYFSDRSAGSTISAAVVFNHDLQGNPAEATLKFDPGWNSYVSTTNNPRNPLMEDMAVMLVPTDAAIAEWWQNGEGAVIRKFYEDLYGDLAWDSIPNSVVRELINNNMLEDFTSSVPSKFAASVKDDASEPMGITRADVDSVILGCNGAVYLTNKVFSPSSFRSVLYPAVVNTTTMSILNTAVNCLDYKPFLNAKLTGTKYSFFIPLNDGFLTYIDPVSYGQTKTRLWEFHFDETKAEERRIYADVYECTIDPVTGEWVKDSNEPKDTYTDSWTQTMQGFKCPNYANPMVNRMLDVLDNILVIGAVEEGKYYYKTKGNSFVKIENPVSDPLASVGAMKVYGTWQADFNKPLNVTDVYKMENGNSYILDGVIMGTRKSVADVLAERTDCSEFFKIVQVCALNKKNDKDKWVAASNDLSAFKGNGNLLAVTPRGVPGNEDATAAEGAKVAYLLNAYHYTIYAPNNDAMQKAYAMGLPTADSLARAMEYDDYCDSIGVPVTVKPYNTADSVLSVMLDFVKYHIQDNAIYVDKGFNGGVYESAKVAVTYDAAQGGWIPGRPYTLRVNVTPTTMTVTDVSGEVHNVLTGTSAEGLPLHNIQAREYWLGGSLKNDGSQGDVTDYEKAAGINNTSSAVVHVIDGPLVYDKDTQFQYTYKKFVESSAKPRRK